MSAAASSAERTTMNGKPVVYIEANTVVNLKSGFGDKLLSDFATFSTGSACAYNCSFCYVPPLMGQQERIKSAMQEHEVPFEGLVVRRRNALETLKQQLTGRKGKPRFSDPNDTRVIYSSPLVDVAANLDLARETIEACKIILAMTHWQIRLLSKSSFLPYIAKAIPKEFSHRMIYGVSTGTLNDNLAASFESGAALPSKRIHSLWNLQDAGYRTFGMICPSLPQSDYSAFSAEAMAAIRVEYVEHVWCEVINVRGASFVRTVNALQGGGFHHEASELSRVSMNREAWEKYARDTYLGHLAHCDPSKLRFLQYLTKRNQEWWTGRPGAVLLGAVAHQADAAAASSHLTKVQS